VQKLRDPWIPTLINRNLAFITKKVLNIKLTIMEPSNGRDDDDIPYVEMLAVQYQISQNLPDSYPPAHLKRSNNSTTKEITERRHSKISKPKQKPTLVNNSLYP